MPNEYDPNDGNDRPFCLVCSEEDCICPLDKDEAPTYPNDQVRHNVGFLNFSLEEYRRSRGEIY